MKNPNGYGSVCKLSGKRRKPFAVIVTTGWNDEGKQRREYLGYYKSRKEAMVALADYNNNPYDLSAGKLTFKEVYERLIKERFPKISKSNQLGYEMAFRRSEPLHDIKFNEVRKAHLQSVIDNCDKSWGTKKKNKSII
ncbi:hypothetical protein [Oceanobacillus alkalisoli]|uniref:hypothetical protein n=1 Tax=Oceanobacillus alkalisoli TaxID=2925113 RepID=UPI001EE46C35|nr:hypothetical protein [Oceanobacillus alkalisoli]MCG5104587.1 hypothetical protein [Oceanobacillus alkalisoli]